MKVLLVADVPGWAWDHKAHAIQKNLYEEFDAIDIAYTHSFRANFFMDYDAVHFFGWIEGNLYADGSTAGVSSYNYEWKHQRSAWRALPRFKAITAVSRMLYERLKGQKLNKNIYCTPNGVDEEMFYPKKVNEGAFTVGWLGQPTGGRIGKLADNEKGPIDQHGYENVLAPLKERLKDIGINYISIEKNHTNALPHDSLCDFYNKCDCVIHTGYLTGTPNPIFEAAACGKAVVCTRVGAAVDMIQDGVNGYVLDSYTNVREAEDTIGVFVKKLKYLKDNRDLCRRMGRESRQIILKDWTWKQRARQWLPVLKKHGHKEDK